MTKSSSHGTRHIGVRPATNIFHAVRFAADRGAPLNLAVTINWHRLGIDDSDATRLFRDLRRRLARRWKYLCVSKPGIGRFHDVSVQENPGGTRNTHWLIRVPAMIETTFRADVSRFLKKLVGLEEVGRALHMKPVESAGSYAKYLNKGVNPAFGPYFRTTPSDQGFIEGRGRTSVARDLSFAARQREGWTRKRRPKWP